MEGPANTEVLALALLVLCVLADHAHYTAARNHLALDANLLYRCSDFHLLVALPETVSCSLSAVSYL